MDPKRIVEIDYTNWRGERRVRQIVPQRVEFENSEWHPETQWVLYATDVEKGETRAFAVKDIHSWRPQAEVDPNENRWLKHCLHGQTCFRENRCIYGCPIGKDPKLQDWMREEAAKTMSAIP